MSKSSKTYDKVMSGQSDANISFADMCVMLAKRGFVKRRSDGSHCIFQKGAAFLNLQNAGGKVKAYQVRQVREALK